jgi:protein TonB
MHDVLKPEHAGNQMITGWSLSVLLHGALLLALFTLMPKMMVAVQKETFRWDVALVDQPQEQAPAPPTVQASKVAPPPVTPQRQAARPVEPAPQTVTRQVQTREVPQTVQREVQAVMETVQTVAQPQPAPEVVNAPLPEVKQMETAVREAAPADVIRETTSPIERIVAQPVPSVTESAQEVLPVVTSQPTIESRQDPVVTRAPVETLTDSAPVVQQAEPVVNTQAVVRETEQPVQEAVSPVESQPPAPVVARSVTPRPPTRADYGWLADSLFRRVVELRHYPRTARLNGFEGKVVLRVSIKQDGNLEDVSVVQSSGHESLDNAAMEAVRRACPLHLKHELERPKVVMTLPVTYSLGK